MFPTYLRPVDAAVVLLSTLLALYPAQAGAQTEPTPTPTATRAPTSGNSTYFGKTVAPTTTTPDGTRATGVAVPPPATPVLTRPATGYASVIGTAAATPTPNQSALAAETPNPAALTPVGKWRWHAGGDHVLTDKGAILQGTKVVGQWKWLDKSKSQVQVQWTGGPYRPPMTYTLSEHGNHLSGKSPSSGQDHTEERIE